MLDEEVTRLSEPYQGEVKPEEPGLLRVAGPLSLNLATSVALGDEIVDDLDKAVHGIGWWKAYSDLDRRRGYSCRKRHQARSRSVELARPPPAPR